MDHAAWRGIERKDLECDAPLRVDEPLVIKYVFIDASTHARR
jgi:hypothetical protein